MAFTEIKISGFEIKGQVKKDNFISQNQTIWTFWEEQLDELLDDLLNEHVD